MLSPLVSTATVPSDAQDGKLDVRSLERPMANEPCGKGQPASGQPPVFHDQLQQIDCAHFADSATQPEDETHIASGHRELLRGDASDRAEQPAAGGRHLLVAIDHRWIAVSTDSTCADSHASMTWATDAACSSRIVK